MREFNPTPGQLEAITTGKRPVLVSAAAGSGKTRVLTERLIHRVEQGESIDRFLVITFTRAAAAELRGRILAALTELTARRPDLPHLKRQSALLYRAEIGTIDSFCRSVVRENAHLLGVSPGFAMLDEERGAAMRSAALEDVLERAYETIGENDGFRALVDSVGAGRDDARLESLVLSLYGQLQSEVYPEAWAREKLAALDVSGLTDAGETVWGRYLLDDAAAEADYRARALESALQTMAEPGNEELLRAYGKNYSDAALHFRDIARAAADGWDSARTCANRVYPRLTGRVKTEKLSDPGAKDRVKAVWDACRPAAGRLQKSLLSSSAALLSGIERSRPALGALVDLVFALDRAYADRKRRADACDFSDVEHFCVKLLCDGETGGPTALAASLSGRFAEVMVDEYQDVNAVQELIFRRVSGEGERLFMVGDVKQSIYRFRLAEPRIFSGKYEALAHDGNAARILLRENFRSRDAVIDACNAVFRRIMSPALGELVYNDEAALVRAAAYPAGDETLPELLIVDPVAGGAGDEGGADDEDADTADKTLAEARTVAARIRAMVDGGETVADGPDAVRPVGYGDIAVLLRTPGTTGAVYRRALTEAGVPVNAVQGGAFFDQPEVVFCLSALAAADNPRQDVPLVAVMRASPFGFTPDELAAVRASCGGDLWDAVCLRADEDEKCRRLVTLITSLRDLAREEPTDSVLRHLYDRTGILAACAAASDGERRVGDLMRLYEYARLFEADGSRGLFRFVAWLRELEARGMEPAGNVESGGAVRLMSIHKSKGLEFPVVFLADCCHGWARTGTDQVLCHREFGLGMRLTDMERGVSFPTLPLLAIRQRLRREELSEQERVLYVAMTRARERLIMTCAMPNAAEKLEAMTPPDDGPIDPRVLVTARHHADWLIRAALADGGKTMTLAVVRPGEAPTPPCDGKTRPEADETLVAALAERLEWTYPHAGAAALPSKITATGVHRILSDSADPEAVGLAEPEPRRFRVPEPGRPERPLTGAERGIAAHLVMQYIDLAKTGDAAQVRSEIERLRRRGVLDDRQADSVAPDDILAFFRSETGQRLLRADGVSRELRFSLLCPAGRWFPDAPDGEEVLLQGVVDCVIEEDGALTVIDFKTDAVIEPGRYDAQLSAYAYAMERMTGRPVRGAVLWYLRAKQAVAVNLRGDGAEG